jgi:peptidoglycan hydrolase-like protein with peptidoglycan-binding domain
MTDQADVFKSAGFNHLAITPGFVMRSWLAATLMFMTAGGSAEAQMTAPSTAGAKPKAVATVPIHPPGLQTPADTANAMGQTERLALQSDLAWVGEYNGAITGDVSERMVAAIKEYQKARGGKQTGVLNPQERSVLAETARRRQDNAGWKLVTDPVTGSRLGIPTKLVPQQTSDADGTKWTSPTGTIQVLLNRRKEAGPTTAKIADEEKKNPPGRKVDYTVVKPDFVVLSGMQGQKKFYLRGTFKGDEVRVMTILYDQATENTVEPVVIAMSSAFNAFPAATQPPPPRKTVEYSTGMVVTEGGAIVADREATDGCLAITVQGLGHADLLADDKDHGLALLHIYGTQGLKPLALSEGAAKSSVDIIGIADPQNQGGGAAVTSVKSQLTQVGASGDLALSPSPAVGFSGAAALDSDGKFAGLAVLRPVVVATTAAANAPPATQAVLVNGDAVRDFLRANDVTASGTSRDAKAAAVRVICVRK